MFLAIPTVLFCLCTWPGLFFCSPLSLSRPTPLSSLCRLYFLKYKMIKRMLSKQFYEEKIHGDIENFIASYVCSTFLPLPRTDVIFQDARKRFCTVRVSNSAPTGPTFNGSFHLAAPVGHFSLGATASDFVSTSLTSPSALHRGSPRLCVFMIQRFRPDFPFTPMDSVSSRYI